MPDCSIKVTEIYPSLTPSQKMVADYVLEHLDAMAFTTLDDVALQVGVSTTTIIRFARMMGYSGYSDMLREIQSEVMDKVSLPKRLRNAKEKTDLDNLMAEIMQNDIDNITHTVTDLSGDLLGQAVDKILGARNVYVLGMHGAFSLAHYTITRLGQIRPNVRLVQSVGMIFPEEMAGSNSKDVCIAFMFPRYSKIASDIIAWLKKMGVHIVLFTGSENTAVKKYGDIVLPCHIKGVSFKNTYAAPMCVINYIATAATIKNAAAAMEILRQTEDFFDKGYYLGL